MKIRNKFLTAFISLSILPMLIASAFLYINGKKQIEAEKLEDLNIIADINKHAIENYFQDKIHDIEVVMNSWNIQQNFPVLLKYENDRNNPACQRAVEILDSQFAPYTKIQGLLDLMLLNADETILYTSNASQKELEVGKPIPAFNGQGLDKRAKGGPVFSNVLLMFQSL
jgi:hypothetical protein